MSVPCIALARSFMLRLAVRVTVHVSHRQAHQWLGREPRSTGHTNAKRRFSFAPLVLRNSDAWHKSRSAVPGW